MLQRTLDPDLSPDEYGRLLSMHEFWCTTASLALRPSLGLSAKAEELLQRLEPFVLSRSESTAWPGTTLLEGTAIVVTFRFESKVTQLLRQYSDSFLDWQQPELPEDLCLLRRDGTAGLVTIAHEGDAYVTLAQAEIELLRQRDPTLEAVLLSGS